MLMLTVIAEPLVARWRTEAAAGEEEDGVERRGRSTETDLINL
jgi:hypothetical protein